MKPERSNNTSSQTSAIEANALPANGSGHTLWSVDDILAAGLAKARALGAEPIAVVDGQPPAAVSDVSTVVVTKGLLSEAEAPSPQALRHMLVFPGPADRLRAAITANRVPGCTSALVLEDGQWQRIDLEAAIPSVNAAVAPPSRAVTWAYRAMRVLNRHIPSAVDRLQSSLQVRRLQPLVDRRENAILAALWSATDFPFRIAQPMERCVLFGIGQLGGGGAERQIVNTAEGLKSRGISAAHILLISDDGKHGFYRDKAAHVAAGIHAAEYKDIQSHHWLAAHPEWRELASPDLMNRIFGAAKVIAKVRPSVVQTSLDWPNVVVGMAAVLCGVPSVFMSGRNLAPHHFEFFQWFMYPCYRALIRHPSVTMTNNSVAGRQSYARWLKVKPNSIRVIRNGLQADEFPLAGSDDRVRVRRQLEISPDAPVVTGAFRLSAEKRPLLWLEAAAMIRQALPSTTFLLCGAGNMEEQVKARAVALGFGDSLRLLGARSDIFAVFSASDLVMQASLQEGTPNTLIEAQAMGLPVVTTRAFGAAEAVVDGKTGTVVRRDTPKTLADAAISILNDADLRTRALEDGPHWIEERFGFERMIDDTLVGYADSGVPWAIALLPEGKKFARRAQLREFVHDGGFCWRASCPELTAIADTLHAPHRSTAILREAGQSLGPSHAAHNVIRSEGRGAFSHWSREVYMSTTDNSSPLENGRQYELVIPRGLARPSHPR
jgi:glycosyltransferase involved in cell wall biosynthesis